MKKTIGQVRIKLYLNLVIFWTVWLLCLGLLCGNLWISSRHKLEHIAQLLVPFACFGFIAIAGSSVVFMLFKDHVYTMNDEGIGYEKLKVLRYDVDPDNAVQNIRFEQTVYFDEIQRADVTPNIWFKDIGSISLRFDYVIPSLVMEALKKQFPVWVVTRSGAAPTNTDPPYDTELTLNWININGVSLEGQFGGFGSVMELLDHVYDQQKKE